MEFLVKGRGGNPGHPSPGLGHLLGFFFGDPFQDCRFAVAKTVAAELEGRQAMLGADLGGQAIDTSFGGRRAEHVDSSGDGAPA